MGSALEAVLALKRMKDVEQQQKTDNLTQSLQMFQQARQQAVENKMKKMTLDATLKQNELENARKSSEDKSQMLLRDAQTKQLNASAEFLNRNLSSSSDSSTALKEAGIPQEDIQLTPKTFSYRGMQTTKMVPELKKQVSQAETDQISQIDSTISDISKNTDTLLNKHIKSGPGYATSNLPGADIYSQFTKTPEFNTWKADTGRAFQKYRKWATGVAAGYPELNLLAPNFPKASDTPENYTAKAKSAIDDMKRNKDNFLNHLNKAGYRTSELRGKSNDQLSTPSGVKFSYKKL